MTGKRDVPVEILQVQAEASSPESSVWVSANAGSGKTHVLSQRVIRLLLDGVEPSKVLCLTYTRAAAANMANRVFGQLSEWATLPDAELSERIEAVEHRWPTAAKLTRARQLFAEALDTPGGLKIQTIHAFCESILHQFPLEANIAGHFEMLDGTMEQALFAEARSDIITGAGAAHDPELAEAFAVILARSGEFGLELLLGEIVRLRDRLRLFIDELGRADAGALRTEFGFGADETAASVADAVWPLPGFPPDVFSAFVANAEATDAAQVIANMLPDAMQAYRETNPVERLRRLASGFLTEKGEAYRPSTFRKTLVARMPDLPERYAAAVERIIEVRERAALFTMLEDTGAALIVADRMIGRYERLKSARGFLDFNDLINRTVRLLARTDVGPWIHYKLDQGIDHILLDEAQDTSPDQWQVVRRLAEEFFTGLGARDGVRRTVFAVGDEKQSIYSFQGADPAGFESSRQSFRDKAQAAETAFRHVRLEWSFRSTDDVLQAVDTVFSLEPARKGLSSDGAQLVHRATRSGEAGYVEVWPSLGDDSPEQPDDWREAVDHARAPAVLLADIIADRISEWIKSRDLIEGKKRVVRAGDILVLVRKRDRFIHALSRSLKQRGVPVAGADRLSLRGHIAVQDMMALGRFIIQPADDLSLAALLRSPVFGLSDKELYAIAATRKSGASLFEALREKAATDLVHRLIVDRLIGWQNEAAFRPVFEFYATVLGRDGVRRKMVGRLGEDAGDILDEFLSFCLAEEKAGLPGLDAFLETLESAAPEIRREMDQGRNEVRIMTAHAAKGLEAPIVFLVDGGSAPFSQQHLPRLMPFTSATGLWRGDGFLWRAKNDTKNQFSQGAAARIREKAEDEYRRLLYVGLTRAEDRLIVCAYHGRQAPLPTNWHGLVRTALSASPFSSQSLQPELFGPEPVIRFRVSKPGAPPAPIAETVTENEIGGDMPGWLATPLPDAPPLPRPLSPSAASVSVDERVYSVASSGSPVLGPGEETSFAVLRGQAVHKLLQILPDLPSGDRRPAADRYLTRIAADWQRRDREDVLDSVLAVLDHPEFAPIFAPDSRAEVSLMGRVAVGGIERPVSAKVDRLAVSDAGVHIVDYKTNRPPPRTLAEVPQTYVTQLALYRALLQPIYPGKAVEAALLFTEAPRLIVLPGVVLDAALARLTQA